MSNENKPLPHTETIDMKSGTELVVIYTSGQMWTNKDGNIVNYDWLADEYLKLGGRLDQLCPNVGDKFDRKDLSTAMYNDLTNPEMQEKYKDHLVDGTVRANLIQREARMVYFLTYLGILKKKEGRTGVFERTAKANQVQATWATERVTPATTGTPAEGMPVLRRVVIAPQLPAADSDRQQLMKAYKHHRSEEAFHRATADALAKVLGLEPEEPAAS